MRRGVARQNSNVHPDSLAGETEEPFHGRAGKVRTAWRGIASRTDASPHHAAGTVNEIAVETGMMVRVLFHDREVSFRCLVPASAG